MRAVIGPRRRKTARGQVAEERTRMPDLHRARTRHQSPRISEVRAESEYIRQATVLVHADKYYYKPEI